MPDLYAYMWVPHHIVVPDSRSACGIYGRYIELAIVRNAIDCDRVREQIPCLGLKVDLRNLVGKRPIGYRSAHEISSEPQAGDPVMRFKSRHSYDHEQ